MRRREPRAMSHAIAALADRLAPQTTLAEVQRVWPEAVGEVVAAQAEPTARARRRADGDLRVGGLGAGARPHGPRADRAHQRGARHRHRALAALLLGAGARLVLASASCRRALGAGEVAVAGLDDTVFLRLKSRTRPSPRLTFVSVPLH